MLISSVPNSLFLAVRLAQEQAALVPVIVGNLVHDAQRAQDAAQHQEAQEQQQARQRQEAQQQRTQASADAEVQDAASIAALKRALAGESVTPAQAKGEAEREAATTYTMLIACGGYQREIVVSMATMLARLLAEKSNGELMAAHAMSSRGFQCTQVAQTCPTHRTERT